MVSPVWNSFDYATEHSCGRVPAVYSDSDMLRRLINCRIINIIIIIMTRSSI